MEKLFQTWQEKAWFCDYSIQQIRETFPQEIDFREEKESPSTEG